jgi:hypothetical protein
VRREIGRGVWADGAKNNFLDDSDDDKDPYAVVKKELKII